MFVSNLSYFSVNMSDELFRLEGVFIVGMEVDKFHIQEPI